MNTPSTTVSPGILGFIFFFALAIALWLLVRNMNSRLRRMQYREEQQAGRAQGSAAPDAPPAPVSGPDAPVAGPDAPVAGPDAPVAGPDADAAHDRARTRAVPGSGGARGQGGTPDREPSGD